MIFHINAVSTFLVLAVASTTTFSVEAKLDNPTNRDLSIPCYDYSNTFGALGADECTERKLFTIVRDTFREQNMGPTKKQCKGGLNRDLMALTSSSTIEAARQVLTDMCEDALADATEAAALSTKDTWEYLELEPYPIDLDLFFEGQGHLNDETGNFQQNEATFLKRGGYDKFNYIGEDVRLNDHYPTSQDSYEGGKKILEFNGNEAKSAYLSAPTIELEGGCPKTNTAVCCWHRDRQYFDNNGDCMPGDCANQMPGDNTDLCWTEGGDDGPHPYPNDVTEGDLHCHGFAWSTLDETDGDVNTNAKWNNLFYIAMYDHLYTRGYADSITDDPRIMGNEQAMCGCAEDMSAKVVRADCTEAVGRTNYTASLDTNGLLSIEHVQDSFQIHFRACEGFDYDDSITPAQYEEEYNFNSEDAGLDRSDNDLSAFVFRQFLESKLEEDHVLEYEKSVIGYRTITEGDTDEEKNEFWNTVCAEKFTAKFPNEVYIERTTESTATVE